MLVAETMVDLLTDLDHWGFELVATVVQDVIIVGLAWPLVKRAVARHDRDIHGH